MMKKRAVFYFCFCAFLLFSCQKKDVIVLEGDIRGGDGKYVYFTKLDQEQLVLLDSVKIKNGMFSISLPTKDAEPAFYQIGLSNENALMTLARRGEKIHFSADADDLIAHYSVSGADDAVKMCDLDRQLRLFIDSTDYLLSIYQSTDDDSIHAEIERCYNSLKIHHTNFLRSFIKNNSQSLVVIIAFYQKYNNAHFFAEKEDAELLQFIYNSLQKAYPNNEYVHWLKKRIADDQLATNQQ